MVAKEKRTDQDTATTPRGLAESTPGGLTVYDRNTQYFADIQRSIGGLTEAVKNLTKEVDKHDSKLDAISHKVFAAEVLFSILGVLLVAFGIGFWNKFWSVVAALSQVKP